MEEEKIIEIIEKLLHDVDKEYGYLKAEAYDAKLTDNYAITLRDNFNINKGKEEILRDLKNVLLNKVEQDYKEKLDTNNGD